MINSHLFYKYIFQPFFVLLTFLISESPLIAQAPEITGSFPSGGQIGSTAVIKLDGKNLQNAHLLLSGSGIAVNSVKPNTAGDQIEVKLTIDAAAALGPREIRFSSTKGVSNPTRIWVGVFPEISETEPNDTPQHPQKLQKTPATINGRLQVPTDQDIYSFYANAGETWVFDCTAAKIWSHLDPLLELRDELGATLQSAESFWESDPRLVYKFKKSGTYTITIRDTQFSGGNDYFYRLTVGPIPVITGFLPRGGHSGSALQLRLQGINSGSITRADIVLPAKFTGSEVWMSIPTANGPSLPISLLVNNEKSVMTSSETINVDLIPRVPMAIDGYFETKSVRSFKFHADAKEIILFDLLGRRIESQIDGALRIIDSKRKELAANDDAVGKDSRLEWTAPTAGIYTVELRNVEEKTGPNCFWRLEVSHPEPDFELKINSDRLSVGADGTSILNIQAERYNGFDGVISVHGLDIPEGVSFSGGFIGSGQKNIDVTLTAKSSVPLESVPIRLIGVASINKHKISHEFFAREQYMPRSIDPAMFQDASYQRPFRECALLPLAVVARSETFALESSMNSLKFSPGKTVDISVHARRKKGDKADIKIEVRGLPQKVTVSAATLTGAQEDAKITFTVTADAPAAVGNLIIVGSIGGAQQAAPAVSYEVHK